MFKTVPWVLLVSFAIPAGQSCSKTTVVGRVTDAEGKPIAGARLEFADLESPTPVDPSQTRSDVDGRFVLPGSVGKGQVSVGADGYPSMYLIRPTSRGVNEDWDFQLPKTARVSGRVLDTRGKPLRGRVLGFRPVVNALVRTTAARFSASDATEHATDENGVFDIPAVAPCRHRVVVGHTGGCLLQLPVQGKFVDAKPGAHTAGVEIRVHPPEDYAISGHVKDAQGKPVSRVLVDTCIPSGSHWFATTDAQGAYCLQGLDGMATTSFKVNFAGEIAGKSFKLALAGVPLNSKAANIVVPGRGGIHGVVRNAKTGKPVAACRVEVPRVRLPDSGAAWDKPAVQIAQRADGSFRMSDVPGGEATIDVRAEGLGAQRFVVPVAADATSPLKCDMLGPAVLAGKTTLDGQPRGTSIVIDGQWLPASRDGNFRFDQFPNGDYTLWFFGWGDGWNHRSAEVRLKSGETTRLDMELGGSCEVRGSIAFPNPDAPCMVRIASQPAPDGWPSGVRPSPEEFVLSYSFVQQSGGEYRLRAIPAGRWRLMVGQLHAASQRYLPAVSKQIELKEGETLSLSFDLSDNADAHTAIRPVATEAMERAIEGARD